MTEIKYANPTLKNNISRETVRAASQWLMKLNDGEVSAQDIQAWQQWRQADLAHEAAWQQAEKLTAKFGLLSANNYSQNTYTANNYTENKDTASEISKASENAGTTNNIAISLLNRKERDQRRNTLKTLMLLFTATPASYLAYRTVPWQTWSADYHTAKGEQQRIKLSDGSIINLNTDTAIDVHFSQQQRLVVLHHGEILVTTASDSISNGTSDSTNKSHNKSNLARPFIVQTNQGKLQAIGTKFIVREITSVTTNSSTQTSDNTVMKAPYTKLIMLAGAVNVTPKNSSPVQGQHQSQTVISAGQQALVFNKHVGDISPIDKYSDSWSNGLFVAQNIRLIDFIAEISRYHTGLLRCDPSVANLQISGTFKLNHTDKILMSLTDTLPIKLQYRTKYWLTILPR